MKLGGGNFATVWKGISKSTAEEVAVKIVVKHDANGALSAEANPLHAEILMMLNHKNIIQLKDYFDEEKALCLVLELATGGDIVEKVSSEGTFSEAAAVQYCRQILSALAHCHKRGMVHCDLKCENILFASKDPASELKIADFGLAQVRTPTPSSAAAVAAPLPSDLRPSIALPRPRDHPCSPSLRPTA